MTKQNLALLGLMTIVANLTGCASTPTKAMPTREAWDHKEQEATNASISTGVTALAGSISGVDASGLVGAWEKEKERELAQANMKMRDEGMPSEALDFLVDQSAMDFVKSLSANRTVNESDHQFVMVVDNFGSRPGEQNDGVLVALKSLVSRLQKNETLQESFVFREGNMSKAENVLNAVSGKDRDVFKDVLGDGPDLTGMEYYHPDDVYLLTGEMYNSPSLSEYRTRLTLFLKVTKVRNNKDYWYHPDLGWISDEKEQELQAAYSSSK
jgi:hypothetical protein